MTQRPTTHDTAPAVVSWVVAVSGGRVLHPQGVSPLPGRTERLAATGTHDVDGSVVSWAFGYVAPDAPTPAVTFAARNGLRRHEAAVRRLTATVWTAQADGRWSRVRVP